MKPKILIYIPTFRRPKALAKQLANLKTVCQLNKQLQIDILVSSNADHDDALDQIENDYQWVTFRKNPINIGADLNIALGFILCAGYHFLWILSDDDFISPDIDLAHLCGGQILFDLAVFDDKVSSVSNKRQKLTYVDFLNSRIGLISDVIYRVESIKASVLESIKSVNSCFPHLCVMAAEFSRKEALILSLPRSEYFEAEVEYTAETVTDYAAARVGILSVSKYLSAKERFFYHVYYSRRSSLEKIPLVGSGNSVTSMVASTLRLSPAALPILIFFYLARRIQNTIKKIIRGARNFS